MKSERFKRTKSVVASGAIALVVAALAFGVSSSVLGPKSAIAQHLGFDLTSGTSSFTITSSIYPSPACSGSTALLYPGTPRCMVFSVHNNLSVPISVGSITSALDTTDYPAPPPACAGTNVTLPTYSGSLAVPANGDATSSGVPVELNDSGSTQDICQAYTYHFTYSGLANYTDSTTTALTSAPNPSSSSQSVTFTATVTETNASIDPSGPTGTVTFYSCTSNTCGSTTSLGTGSVGSNGQATLSTSSLPVGTDYIEAVYGGSGSNLTGSTSNVVTQTVTSGSISTTSILTSSANPSSYGSSVTFTDTVSASSGTPGGTVTFNSCTTNTCSTKTSLASETLSSGKATYATASLPVGTTYVEAIYGASGSFLGSTSNVVSQVVNTLGTTSVLAASANPSTYGTSVTFTDTVSASMGTPGGTVTFYSCTTNTCGTKTSLGTGTLSSDTATYSTSALPVGTTYVEAVYGASGNYGGSTSNVVTQVVNALGTTSVLTSSPNPSPYGSSVTFTDTVSSGSSTPAGTVTFYSCMTNTCSTKTSLGTETLASGKATYSTSTLPVGTTYVEAVYGASGNYGGSTSNVVSQVVNALSTTSVLTSSPNPSNYGSSVSFTDTVSASTGTPSGTVTFYSCSTSACTSTTSLGTGTLSSGKATLSTSTLPAGTTYVEAVYAASGDDGGSTSNVVTQVVNALSTTTALTSSSNPSTYGTSLTFTAAVSATTGTPGGTVTFYSCTTSACSTKTSLGTGALSSGKATYVTSSLPVGTTYVEAVYGASGNYLDSTSDVVSQVVNALSTTSSLTSSANPSNYGSSVTFTDTVSASTGTPSGAVSFYTCTTSACSTKTSLGTGTLSGGSATYATSSLPLGTTYVEAVYAASGNYLGSTSNVVSQVVNALSTTSSLASLANPSPYGSSVTFTDTVSATTGTPSGTVTFYSCTTSACSTKTSLGTGTLSSGKATYSTSSLPVGPTYVEAVYGASGNYLGSTSNVVTQVVNALSTTSSLASSANPSVYGTSVTFTDTVSASSGTPSGTVSFYGCSVSGCTPGALLGTGTLSSGKATFSSSILPVGTTYVDAVYGASGNYASSTSGLVSEVVTALSTASSLTSSPNPSTPESSVTFTDTVSASSGTPAGSVVFYTCTTSACSSKTQLGTSTLSGGTAMYSTSSLPVSADYVEAVFSATGNYLGSTSNVVTQSVLNAPSVCASNGYGDVITANPSNYFVYGTNGNDLIYAFGASYWVNGYAGNDCIDAGDGNNVLLDGNGNDGVAGGNGSDTVIIGNGNDAVSLGNGSDGVETGNGNDAITLGTGSNSEVIVGSGNDTVTIGSGSSNEIELGSGTDTVTIQGSQDTIDGGTGNETIYLGSGTDNSYSGVRGKTNTCHLPLYNGKAGTAAEYHDTITNCTVVSP